MNNSGKGGLLHWYAFQIDFEKCHFRKRILSDKITLASGAVHGFFGKIGVAPAPYMHFF